MKEKSHIVVVQYDIMTQRYSGYLCENGFNNRTGGFSSYPKKQTYRRIYMTCGGCCGRAVYRKLNDLIRMIEKSDKVEVVARIFLDLIIPLVSHKYVWIFYNGFDFILKNGTLRAINGTVIIGQAEGHRFADFYLGAVQCQLILNGAKA